MKFIKHIGKHGDKKVAVIFRQVPNEDHMCLVTYTETLPRIIHDELMRTIDQPPAQNTTVLGEVLGRTLLPNGQELLRTLHTEHLLKRVPCNQVTMTPSTNNTIRLDELNKLLNDMETGDNAAKKLADLDANAGLVDPSNATTEMPAVSDSPTEQMEIPIESQPLDDTSLAMQRVKQAAELKAQAKQLTAEAKRLTEEARKLDESVVPATRRRPRKKAAAAA